MPEPIFDPDKKPLQKPPEAERPAPAHDPNDHPLADLHRQVGNRAVQRLIQRSGGGPAALNEETESRINAERGSGQALDAGTQESLGGAMGYDFSGVRVHDTSAADSLSEDLGAEAFTTGQDVFFREGAYDPDSGDGQELLAHELTHVVQQDSGQAGGSGGPMTVNEPGDTHEQQADAVAQAVVNAPVQRQDEEEEMAQMRPAVQRQEEEELDEDEISMKAVQRQEEDEEELAQTQPTEEEEELPMA